MSEINCNFVVSQDIKTEGARPTDRGENCSKLFGLTNIQGAIS